MEPKVGRMPRFAAEDGGLASLSVVDLGFSERKQRHAVFSRSVCSARGGFSFRNVGACSVSSPRSPAERYYDATFEDQQPHFLHACFLCKKPIGSNRDIFMYRGDTPFCSDECRQEQINIDEAKENSNWNLSSSMKALRNRDQRNPNSSATRAQDYSLHAGTVAAA